MTRECARKREREKREIKVNNTTPRNVSRGIDPKRYPKMESQKSSSSRSATFQRKKEAGEGRRERETKQNVFDERGKKREF